MTGIQERNILTALLEEHIAKFRLRLHSDVNQYNKQTIKKQPHTITRPFHSIKQ